MILERLRDGAPMFSTMEAQGRCKPEKTLSHEMKLLSHRGDYSFAAAEVQMCVSELFKDDADQCVAPERPLCLRCLIWATLVH